jgi:hypothetical protein
MKLEIIKQRIEAPSRKLDIKWTLDSFDFEEEVRKKPETEEEEAEEIIYRLKAPPRKKRNNTFHGIDLEKELTEALSKSIAEEIDKEIMSDLYGQRKNRTR